MVAASVTVHGASPWHRLGVVRDGSGERYGPRGKPVASARAVAEGWQRRALRSTAASPWHRLGPVASAWARGIGLGLWHRRGPVAIGSGVLYRGERFFFGGHERPQMPRACPVVVHARCYFKLGGILVACQSCPFDVPALVLLTEYPTMEGI